MKFSILILLFLSTQTFGALKYSAGNYGIYITPKGTYFIPQRQSKEKDLKGYGMTFQTTVTVKEEKTRSPDGKQEMVTKKISGWIRGCGVVEFPSNTEEEKDIKNGDRVELKFEKSNSCNIIDWKKL